MTNAQSTPVIPQFNKDPDADLDYQVNWSVWMKPGDTIATSTWIPDPLHSGLNTHTESHDSFVATTWFTGGTMGVNYTVVNRIVTTAGRSEDQTIRVYIQPH